MRTVLRGGAVVDGAGGGPLTADLALADGVVDAVGVVPARPGDRVVDVTGRYVLPGFVDVHSHADGAVFDPLVQRALLRQGVTTVVVGQDGVSYAPGDGSYATDYFAAVNGPHPTYSGGGVGSLLDGYDGTTPVNVGYLVPAGTVRHEVMGFATGAPTAAEGAQMRRLVADGLAEGALGLSTGLDYVPDSHASTADIIDLCRPVAEVGGLYVTHMRGGYEDHSAVGTDEVRSIALATGVAAHISHLHGPSALLLDLLAGMAAAGVDVTFDSYPYRRGCTLLAMPILPPHLLAGTRAEVVARLRDPDVRTEVRTTWLPALEANPVMGPGWARRLTITHVTAPEHGWVPTLTLEEAAGRAGLDPMTFALDLLASSGGAVGAIMTVRDQRAYGDVARLLTHPAHMAGSDGIYVGRHPHPRGWGTFAKYLRLVTRERGDYTWAEAAEHLAGRPAQRFGLGRGLLASGLAADVVVLDPDSVADVAEYSTPTEEATGVDRVFVAGREVLADGRLTGVNAGQGIRRSTKPSHHR